MFGVIAGNIRDDRAADAGDRADRRGRRDRANGLVGTTSGVSFLVTSVISGVLVAAGGMFWVLVLALGVLAVAVVHLASSGAGAPDRTTAERRRPADAPATPSAPVAEAHGGPAGHHPDGRARCPG